MSLYNGAKTKVRLRSELFEKSLVQVDVNQGSVLSPLLLAIAVDVKTEYAKKRLMNKMLHANDMVLINNIIEHLRKKFSKWKKTFESKGLNINLTKTKVIVSGSKDEVLRSKVDPYAKCGKKVMASSVVCTKCSEKVRCTVDAQK